MRFRVKYVDYGVYVDDTGRQYMSDDDGEKLFDVETNKQFNVIDDESYTDDEFMIEEST